MLLSHKLLLGLQRRVWQLAFVPKDRAAQLRAQLLVAFPGSGVMCSLLPAPPQAGSSAAVHGAQLPRTSIHKAQGTAFPHKVSQRS